MAQFVERDIEEEVGRILNTGGEGMVLKKRDAIYYPGKRPAWTAIKFKQMDDVDLVCTRTIPATRNYTGKELDTWPYWEAGIRVTKPYALGWKTAIEIGCYAADDKTIVSIGTVSSGLTDEMREGLAKHPEEYIGKVCELAGMEKDREAHTLRHFHFRQLRPEKIHMIVRLTRYLVDFPKKFLYNMFVR